MKYSHQQNEFKKEHNKFINLRLHSIAYNGKEFCERFDKDSLICHFMLENELFYVWDDENAKRALDYIKDAYPESTIEDLRRVYEEKKDSVFSIYG